MKWKWTTLAANINDCYVSYLRYLHGSIENMSDVVCREDDNVAIQRALVEDLSKKFYGANDKEQLKALHKKVDTLNTNDKEYLTVLI